MLYIYKMEDNVIITDDLGETLTGPLVIYIDDVLIGTFENESNDNNYIQFTILSDELTNINNAEGLLKIYNYDKLIKQELISILDFSTIKPVKTKEKNNSIKYYK